MNDTIVIESYKENIHLKSEDGTIKNESTNILELDNILLN